MALYREAIGYIIHQRNFKDSSLIIEFFSKEHGLLKLVAKGIKKNKKLKAEIHYFSLLKIQFFGKSQLKTLSTINLVEDRNFEQLIEKTAALYLNELLHYCLIDNEPSISLFNNYQKTLENLGKSKLNTLLRHFEKEILNFSGFKLSTKQYDFPTDWLTVNEMDGLVIANSRMNQICQVADLTCFIENRPLTNFQKKNINKLMLKLIDMAVAHRKLYSRELLKSLF